MAGRKHAQLQYNNIGAFASEQWWMLIILFLCGDISLFADIFITLPVFLLLP